jgi:Asp-tRNA(Asn)/Glu-tRNA(Gln) amidotransferase A subunit family amidase
MDTVARADKGPALNDFSFMSAYEMAELIRRRQASPVEIMAACLDRVQSLEPELNAFVTLTPELAMTEARRCEELLMSGADLGPLHGVPMSVKDLIAVRDVRQTFGSRTMQDNIADSDAPAVERIKSAGACVIGKTTTTEFGCKPSSDSPLSGITRNPWNTAKTTGGSSAGAAASVAVGAYPAALGTDGGGSIRIPSSFCGLFGIKAQFGRVPVFPASATPTLAHVGPLTRTVRDAALVLQVIAGFDARDPASVAEPAPDFLAACERPPKGMRIAWSPTLGYAEPTREVEAAASEAVKVFEGLGCDVELVADVMPDPFDLWIAEFYAGVGTKLKEPLANNREIIDPDLVDMLASALDQTIDEYYEKVFARYELRERMRKFLNEFDLLITPTLPVAAFDATEQQPPELPHKNAVNWTSYTYPMNLCGLPSASMPCGFTSEGLPVGLQITSRVNRETDIFQAAAAFEAARPWGDRRPGLGP